MSAASLDAQRPSTPGAGAARCDGAVSGDPGELAALRGALVARHLPRDAAEAHWVEELAFAAWRQRRRLAALTRRGPRQAA